MTSDSKIQHAPESDSNIPDIDEDSVPQEEGANELDVDDAESVFGDDSFPDTAPNSSDGSTKVMTNQALEDMGLQVPSWRSGEETFANPEDEASEPSDTESALDDEETSVVAGADSELKGPLLDQPSSLDFSGLQTGETSSAAQPARESLPLPDVGGGLPAPTLGETRAVEGGDTKEFKLPNTTSDAGPLPPPSTLSDAKPLLPPRDEVPLEASAAPQVTAAPAKTSAKQSTKPAEKKQPVPTDRQEDEQKPSLLLPLLISYASAITLAFLYLLLFGGGAREHHLESLPDVAPEDPKELSYVPFDMELAPGHSLRLGESRRFGNILVEPVRVTYEPIQFRHYANGNSKRPDSAPVLKLWVKFTNVSTDQTIAPLDAPLLLKWVGRSGDETEYTNQYLFQPGSTKSKSDLISIYRMPVAFDWDLVGQNLGKELAPGESYETFIPSVDDETANVDGSVTWRIQIRKGYSQSGNGVTTMIEVNFDDSAIEKKQSA
ncbi:MAG: hypothetical protein R3C18_09595 [Planctomycetaceae bacterium]